MLRLLAVVTLFTAFQMTASPSPAQTEQHADKKECVIILHGLGRTHRSMRKMASALQSEGYTVHNKSYPSGKYGIKYLSEKYVTGAVEFCKEQDVGTIHFVTHSLGGILLRQYLSEHELPNIGRIVMLSPPNQGSEVADVLQKKRFFRWAVGPAIKELGTGAESVPMNLPSPEAETGIIAGSRTSDPWFSWCFSGPNDGKVSVERAKLDGMKDFLVVRHGHTFIMNAPEVIWQTIEFLKQGRFFHNKVNDKTDGRKVRNSSS